MAQSPIDAAKKVSRGVGKALGIEFLRNAGVVVATILLLPVFFLICLLFYAIFLAVQSLGASQATAMNVLGVLLWIMMGSIGYYIIDWPWQETA